ncbi:hypothetical protein CTI30_18810 [Bacillus velezensis]|uniref:hypothetical protein n=1 Tax=Bacillus velezensis TaxID=492670 RepID=UPI001366202F|nr:hypothetical protein [Bacillus velezensis]MVZ95623.1 hypothetical protein [Bacillus velezensis]
MIKVYTRGHKIPEKIKSCIVVSNTAKRNKDAKRLIEKIEADPDRIAEYKTEDGIEVYVSYMDPVK